MAELQHWEQSKALYVFTSLTAGSSHIVTATSRIETILRNARIPFTYIDTATNESAKKLFQRRARGKKLPLLVKEGFVIADLDEVEEWNEFGELEENIGDVDTIDTSITTTPAKMEVAREGGTPSKPAAVASEATPSPAPAANTAAEPKKENKPAQENSVMGSLAAEAAAKAKQMAKKVPTPLLPKTNEASTPSKSKDESKEEKETPLSPSGVPLPMSPAVKSPASIDSAVKSPTKSTSPPLKSPTASHHRHSSTGSAHSFVPERSEPEVREHRGSEVSEVSREEIKRIESECSIKEEDEDEEMNEEDEDAILFGDADEDEDTKSKEKEEDKTPKKPANRLSVAEPVLTPVTEEKHEDASIAPKPLNIKGGAGKPEAVMKSAGLTPKEPDDAVEDEEDEEDSDEEESEDEAESPAGKQKATTSPAKDEVLSSKSTPAGTSSTSTSTTPSDTKLASAVEKVKIEDQQAAEGKQATVSVED